MELSLLEQTDPEIAAAIHSELERQQMTIELIASENIVSPAIMAAQGSVLTNKYAEGYPNSRYYGGCEYVDIAEQLAIDRAKALFGAEYVNVQPHSGSQANMAAYFALLDPGDTVLGMALSHGGHLTHGSSVNFSGKLFCFISYGVNTSSETLDFEEIRRLAEAHRPKMIVAGASAYPRTIDFRKFREIADSVGAYFMVDMAHIAGLVAADIHPSPISYADVVTSTTHKTLRGPRGGLILAKAEHGQKLKSQIFPGIQGGPLMHVIAAKAVAFAEAQTDTFRSYQQAIVANAAAMAKRLQERNIRLVSGGTDNHLMLADLSDTDVSGKAAEEVLERAGITANKNAVPNEQRSPQVTSGIRLGTPAVTSRGMGVEEMTMIADMIADILTNVEDTALIQKTRARVRELCEKFPIYTTRH